LIYPKTVSRRGDAEILCRGGKMAASLDEWVCRENLKRLRSQLQEAQDRSERSLLIELIAHERGKLDRLARTNKPR